MTDVPQTADEPPPSRGPWRWLRWVLLAAVAGAALLYGGILIYTELIKDSPPPLSESRPEITAPGEIVRITSPEPLTTGPTGTSPTEPTNGSIGPTAAAGSDPAAEGSSWAATDASIVGYRIKEVLFGIDAEGVGRTNQVAGNLTFAGTTLTDADFTVDMATVESDDSRRDNQFRGSIMSVDEFPTATFELTEPIEAIEPTEGATLTATAAGDLTLRGVTQSVTFDLSARVENGQIVVDGAIPIVFADYGIANPSRSGITTEDNGLLEFSLVFSQV